MRYPISSRERVSISSTDGTLIYVIAVPTVLGKTQVAAEMVEAGLFPVDRLEVLGLLQDLIPQITAIEDTGRAIELIQGILDDTTDDALLPGDLRFLKTLEAKAVIESTEYGTLLARQMTWGPQYQWISMGMFLVDILDAKTNEPVQWLESCLMPDPLKRMSDDALSKIPPQDFTKVANELATLLTLGPQDKKNSDLQPISNGIPLILPEASPLLTEVGGK